MNEEQLLTAAKAFVRGPGQSYLRRRNITSIGIGYRMREGRRTDELCVQFTVERKLAPERLSAENLEELPRSVSFGGVEIATDVLERRYAPSYRLVVEAETVKDPRKLRRDPIVPGISVAHYRETAGTIGCIAYDAETGTPYILSNWHVLQGPQGRIGDSVVQPGPFDDNRIERNRLGALVRSHLGVAGDCAVASIEDRRFAATVEGLGVAVGRLAEPELGDRVIKSGRTTAVTRGIVTRVEMTIRLDYGPPVGEALVGGFEIEPDPEHPARDNEISMGGDSGSAWLACADDGQPTDILVGLHFAGESGAEMREHAVACYADAVCKKLEVVVAPPGLAAAAQPAAQAEVGYDPMFVGRRIDPPEIRGAARRDLVVIAGSPVIRHTHFSLAVNGARRFAQWVAWNIDGGRLRALSRRGLQFTFDPAIDARFQAGNDLYEDNRLDRGHLARRADLVWGAEQEAQRANRESFYFTNIAPQHSGFNQSEQGGLWGRLENAIFEDVDVLDLHVSVFAGPVFGANDVDYRGIRIPREFWKVIAFVDAQTELLQAKGFVLTQADLLNRIEALGLEPFRLFRVPLADIEARTGLDFGALREADTSLPPTPSAVRRRRRRDEAEGEERQAAGIVEIMSLDQVSQ